MAEARKRSRMACLLARRFIGEMKEERTLMADAALESKIIDLIVEITGEDEIGDYRDDDLFEEDVLDSLGAIELLVRIKENFGVSIAPTELERDEMNTANKIIARVEERL